MDDIPPEILGLAELLCDRPEFRKGAVYLSREVEPVLDGLWLVRDWVPRRGLSVIWGPSGAGKSHLAADMACHVARGETWSGNPVEQGLVVYVALEGHGSSETASPPSPGLSAMRPCGSSARGYCSPMPPGTWTSW